MSRIPYISLIALYLIFNFVEVAHAQTSWRQITDGEAGFSISFPGQPTYQTSTDPATGMQIEVYKFFYSDHSLRVTFAPLRERKRSVAGCCKTRRTNSRVVDR